MIQAKRLLIITSMSVGLAACHSNPNTSAKNTSDTSNAVAVSKTDTAGLAAFRAEKKARYEDSLKNVGAQREREQLRTKTSYAAATTSKPRSSYASSGSRTSTSTSGYASSADYPTATKKKSHAARNGALIGAGAGALTGALVTKKNRGVGALIGGVAGGAAGFGVGKIVENKKKKEQ